MYYSTKRKLAGSLYVSLRKYCKEICFYYYQRRTLTKVVVAEFYLTFLCVGCLIFLQP